MINIPLEAESTTFEEPKEVLKSIDLRLTKEKMFLTIIEMILRLGQGID